MLNQEQSFQFFKRKRTEFSFPHLLYVTLNMGFFFMNYSKYGLIHILARVHKQLDTQFFITYYRNKYRGKWVHDHTFVVTFLVNSFASHNHYQI